MIIILMEVHSQMIGSMQNRFFHFSESESKQGGPMWHALELKQLYKKKTTTTTGCKENHFYSLPFGQAEASIYQLRRHFNQPQKHFVLLLFKFLIKHHLPIGQVKNRIHQRDSKIHQPQAIGQYFLCTQNNHTTTMLVLEPADQRF